MIPGRLLYVAAAGTVAISLAWKASAQMHSGAREPDATRGAVIAAQGTPNGAPKSRLGAHQTGRGACESGQRRKQNSGLR
jgi:hypothetical protein